MAACADLMVDRPRAGSAATNSGGLRGVGGHEWSEADDGEAVALSAQDFRLVTASYV
jgi:hypothetical protein